MRGHLVGSSLCILRVLCVSVVNGIAVHHRGTENTEEDAPGLLKSSIRSGCVSKAAPSRQFGHVWCPHLSSTASPRAPAYSRARTSWIFLPSGVCALQAM